VNILVELKCYGGIEEIGGNKLLLNFSKGGIFLDFGQSYKAEGHYFEEYLQPRSKSSFHDLSLLEILPQINGIYRNDAFCPEKIDECDPISLPYWQTELTSYEAAKEVKERIPDAVFLSHAHMDHSGYVGYLGNIPLYCSAETQTLLKTIADIGNLSGFESEIIEIERRKIKQRKDAKKTGYFPETHYVDKGDTIKRTYKELRNNETQTTENEIMITGFNVGHSVPGSMLSLIEADGKQILYTGDIRFHGRNQPDLSGLSGLKPDLMITEGTNIDDDEADNEDQVQTDIRTHISNTDHLVMVGFAWKDIERYETVRDAALAEDKIPVFDPRLAYTLARLGRDIYEEDAKVFVERSDGMIYSPSDYVRSKHKVGLMDFDEWSSAPATRNTDTCHLKEGVTTLDIKSEPNVYVLQLDFYRVKNLLDIGKIPGSKYIRAQCEPFNKRMELSAERLNHWLEFFQINEQNDYQPYHCHASRHACGPDILRFIENVKPKKLVPIHTEKPKAFEGIVPVVVIPTYGVSIPF